MIGWVTKDAKSGSGEMKRSSTAAIDLPNVTSGLDQHSHNRNLTNKKEDDNNEFNRICWFDAGLTQEEEEEVEEKEEEQGQHL